MQAVKTSNHATLKDFVRDKVEQSIMQGDLKPGERLNESKISQDLHVSKSPVREAIKELASEGIIVNVPFKGNFVNQFSEKEILEITSLRSILEVQAVDFAVSRMNPDTQLQLRTIAQKMEEAARKKDFLLMTEIDLEFHHYIVSVSENSILIDVWKKIYHRMQLQLFHKNMMFKDLDMQFRNHMKLADYFSLQTLPIFKNMLIEHIYFFLK